jgi:hypothetical protein
MAQYPPDMAAAARRHLEAANVLNTHQGRPDVAGYLFGIAAECAVKAMMLEANLWPLPNPDNRNGSPYYMHFPELRTALRDSLQGRSGTPLVKFINSDAFLSNWSTNMRYAKSESILPKWIDAWATQARDAVGAIGT